LFQTFIKTKLTIIMRKRLFYLIMLVISGFSSIAQHDHRNCGSMEYLEQQKAADPGLESRMQQIRQEVQDWIANNPEQRNQAVITIPVAFHVVWRTSAENIPDSKILAQIDVLNKDFARLNADAINTPSAFAGVAANTNIQFCLARRDPNGNPTNGIIRRQTTVTSFSTNNNIKFNSAGGSDAWPRTSYMNFWSGNLSNGLLGYAQFPGGNSSTDGVVCLYSSIGSPSDPGTATPYHLGRTATHEVGHWLGLYHIWGDANCGDDLISDTPTQSNATSGCPSYPNSAGCSASPNPPGRMFMNYMDYSYDACMNMFTLGQSNVMNAVLNGTRSSLLSSLGCVPPSGGSTCGTPAGLSATSVTTTSATLNWGSVSGATSYNVRFKPTSSTTWTTGTVTSTSAQATGLTANTQYEFQVQAVCGTTSGAFSGSSTFTTSSGSTCTDIYEPNNSSSAFKTIAVNTNITGLISSSTDTDWFRFTTTSPNTKIRATLSNLPADYDMTLYNSSVRSLASSTNGGTTSETIIRNSNSATTYYLRIYGYNGAFNTSQCYNLRVDASSSSFRLDGSSISEVKADPIGSILVFPNPASGLTSFEFISEIPGMSTVTIVDMLGKVVYTGEYEVIEGVNDIKLDMQNFSKGIHLIMVDQNGERRTGKFLVD
jgi:hypothetical protein